MAEAEWFAANRENWDERVAIHVASTMYDVDGLRAGDASLDPIVDGVLGDVTGLRIAHLQCHFGRDSLVLARRGAASVTGLDFSPPAIAQATELAHELGLPARFVLGNLYDTRALIPEPGGFDLVYATWGTIGWLPDIAGWAAIVAWLLKPGGCLAFAEGHPAALVFDSAVKRPDGLPGFYVPYFHEGPLVEDGGTDYADETATLTRTRTFEWMHPVSRVIGELMAAGLTLEHFGEHDAVPWRMFGCLTPAEDGLFRFADRPWLPLSYALRMRKAPG
ncbi:class I SAM-dependent methyltransferase [Marinivivus vitaminiproducens]|uniref:class I SAM-dependent methyltransferase n=1 Tax=Marinivivus vitaminiproducens TaxID=3035935 RepID=UPI0027A8B64A|nr:class I SAM-dependent methyltransferase [Geminicoccaceae bacterium SCSIO 64248]